MPSFAATLRMRQSGELSFPPSAAANQSTRESADLRKEILGGLEP